MFNFYNKKKILVTGATGFVGSNIILKLSELGAHVTGVYCKTKPFLKLKNVTYKKLDLTDKTDSYKACNNQDFVFMCAAESSGASVMQCKPLTHLTPNVIMNTLILESAYLNNIKKFCFISSSTVYPNISKIIKENDVNFKFFEKYFIVGWMKLFSEKICEMYSNKIKKKMDIVIVRPSNLYGPFDKFDPQKSKVVPSLIKKIDESKKIIKIWGNGKDLKDFIYIEDFIEALLKIFSLKKKDIGPVNISFGKSYSINHLLKLLMSISSKKNLKIVYEKHQPTMIPKRFISNLKLRKLIKWKPINSLKQGLEKTLDWYIRNK